MSIDAVSSINHYLSAMPIVERPPVARVTRGSDYSVDSPETINVTVRPFLFAYDTRGRASARYVPSPPEVTISAQVSDVLLRLIDKQKRRTDVLQEFPALRRV